MPKFSFPLEIFNFCYCFYRGNQNGRNLNDFVVVRIVRRDVDDIRDLMLNVILPADKHRENGLPRIITKSHFLQTFLCLVVLIIVLRSAEVPKLILNKTYKIILDINRKLVGYWHGHRSSKLNENH